MKKTEILDWKGIFFRRKEVWKSTWTLRCGLFILVFTFLVSTSTYWLARMGRSLVHSDLPRSADAIVVDYADPDYLVFECAAKLLRDGISDRLFVTMPIVGEANGPNAVSEGFLEVMLRMARIEHVKRIPVRHEEPITLNVSRQVAVFLQDQGVRSVVLVSPWFRSRRAFDIYRDALHPYGINLISVTSDTTRSPDNWWHSMHGVQQVFLEFAKLNYYRWFVPRHPR